MGAAPGLIFGTARFVARIEAAVPHRSPGGVGFCRFLARAWFI